MIPTLIKNRILSKHQGGIGSFPLTAGPPHKKGFFRRLWRNMCTLITSMRYEKYIDRCIRTDPKELRNEMHCCTTDHLPQSGERIGDVTVLMDYGRGVLPDEALATLLKSKVYKVDHNNKLQATDEWGIADPSHLLSLKSDYKRKVDGKYKIPPEGEGIVIGRARLDVGD